MGHIRPYLCRAVKNKALDYWKHEELTEKYEQQVKLQPYDEPYETDTAPGTKEGFTEAAQNAFEDLPDLRERLAPYLPGFYHY